MKYEPGIVRNDEEKIPAAKAEKDVEDFEKRNEKIAECVPNDMPVKIQDGLAAANAINYDDKVDKEDVYEDDKNNENDEENVIEEMETLYNVSVANYYSPLMKPSPPDRPVTTSSPMCLSSSISSASDPSHPQVAQLPRPQQDNHQQHQHGVGQDDPREESCRVANTLEAKCDNTELVDKEEGFIGPRLPRVMTNGEFKALMDKLLGDKYN